MGNGYLNLLLLLFVIYEWEFCLEQRGREFSAQCNQTSSVAIKQLSTLYWLGCLNFRPKTLYKDPDDGRQRFLLELEFIQCLANPTYIHCKLVIFVWNSLSMVVVLYYRHEGTLTLIWNGIESTHSVIHRLWLNDLVYALKIFISKWNPYLMHEKLKSVWNVKFFSENKESVLD